MTLVLGRGLDDAATPSELTTSFGRALKARRTIRRSGVEHEFAVHDGARQIDFSAHVHQLAELGYPLHPTDPKMFFRPDGSAIIADGLVAEVATPPIAVREGFAEELDERLAAAREHLRSRLPPGFNARGGSTHLNIEVDPALNDQLCLRYARTFAPAMMMLLDSPDSPGLLVRPRPGRTELCGEYIVGDALRVAMTFAIGSVLATEQAIRSRRTDHLPPSLVVEVEPARRRYGWYIDRRGFGPDLYDAGREALLTRTGGGLISAGEHLGASWLPARQALAGLADEYDLRLVDRVVSGELPLPIEDPSVAKQTNQHTTREPTTFGHALATRTRGSYRIAPRHATWDWVAYETSSTSGEEHHSIALVPWDRLDGFLRSLDQGRLDATLDSYLRSDNTGRRLATHAQTEDPGLYDDMEAGPALLPNDRYGVGSGPTESQRIGKTDPPPLQPPPKDPPPRRWWLVLIALVLLIIVILVFLLSGGEETQPPPTSRPQVDPPPSSIQQEDVQPPPTESEELVQPEDLVPTQADLLISELPEGLDYLITKTGDPIPAPFGEIPNGTRLEGSFQMNIDCGGTQCVYSSPYEGDTPPRTAPWAPLEAATWMHDGLIWRLETPALYLSASYPDGVQCVYSHLDTWLLTVTDAEWDGEGWVITAMTGTLNRAEVLDLSLGGGTTEACPPWQAEATWDAEVTGRLP